jgi:hypothetical protein
MLIVIRATGIVEGSGGLGPVVRGSRQDPRPDCVALQDSRKIR